MQPNKFFSLEQVIDRYPLIVAPETPLTEVVHLMQEWGNSCHLSGNNNNSEASSIALINNSCALVVEEAQLQGIFTERDLVRLIATEKDLAEIAVGEVMSRELITLRATGSEDAFTALNLLRQHRIRHLPVVDKGDRLSGLITTKNLRQNLQMIHLMRWRRVKEIMNPQVVHGPSTISLRKAAKLMAEHQVSCVAIVAEDGKGDGLLIPVGIITERDLVQFQTLNLDLAQPVQRLMSTPLFLVNSQDSLWAGHQLMQQHRVRRLLVAGSQGELQGIITQTSLLQVFEPSEMYGVIEALQRQVCQLEIERAEYLQNRTTELEEQVRERTVELTKTNQRLQGKIAERQEIESKLLIQAKQQRAIAELGQYALAQKNLVPLMERAVNLVASILDLEYCKVLELLPDGKNLLLKAGVGWHDGLVGVATVRADTNSQAGYTLLSSEPVVVTDLLSETRFSGSNLLLDHQVVSGMSVVIQGRDRPFGILGTYTNRQRIFSQDDTNFLQAIANIIAQGNERQLAEAELQQQLAFEQLLANISTRFLNLTSAELSQGIDFALQAISELTKVDTSYIFCLSEDITSFSMTHEWVVQETEPQIQNAQNFPVTMFPWSIPQLQQGEILYVPNIDNLPPEATVDRENWSTFNLRSLICIPFKFQNTVRGWIGFASFRQQETWSKRKINLLKVVGEIFASTLQRQQIESALRTSEQRFDSILSSLEDVVWSVDPHTFDRLYINSAVEKIYGHQVAEFYDNPHLWLEMIHPEDRERVSNFAQNILETEGGEIEYRIVRPDGEIRWLCDRAHLIRDAEGTPIRLDGIVTDITRRKQAEDLLRESQESYTLAVEGSSNGLWHWNILTNEVFFAPRFKEILGYTDEEFPDNFEAWSTRLHPEDYDHVLAAVHNHLENHVPFNIEYRLQKKSQEYCWVNARGQAIWNENGQAVRMAGSITDISDRKHQETILKDIASGLSVEIGENFLPSLVEYLCKAIDVKYAFVGELIEPEKDSIKTLAVYGKDTIIDNFEYHLVGTPCQNVIGQQLCVYPEALQQLFPGDRLLQEMAAESYAGMPIFDSAGKALGLISILDTKPLENISLIEEVLKIFATRATAELERQKAESKIRKQAALLDLTHDTVSVRDLNNIITFWNRGAEEMYGWTGQEALGQNSHQLLRAKFSQLLEEIETELFCEGHWQGELIHQRKDGTAVMVMGRWSLLRDTAGNPEQILEINHDITKRKQAEARIREQAALLDVATDAIIVRGLDNQILFWNRGAEKLYGWTREEAFNRNANELLYQEFFPELDEIQQTVRERGEWQGELNQITKTSKEIVVQSRWTLVKDNGENPQSFLVVNTDITEKKQLEAQFLRAQRLESLGTLAGGIAHDLNNILAPILGFAQLLPRKLTNLDEQNLRLFKIIETNAKRGAALVKQILTFARGLEGDRGSIQIRHLLAEIRQVIIETFPKTIELELDAPENLWTVDGDATQIHQVLMNLAVNARDAMPHGGTLRITAENFPIDANFARLHLEAQEGPYVSITVADTGMGIPPVILDRIFEPFFTTKEVGRGTGLGLSTALGIIKSHGGFIDVYSEVERGTQFKVFL
ncbi:MAG: PAS domain S-box protein, partial [Xenococcaceae cyanobacterium MO_234.B1]|nr:PAS domain S-box protein [Xenococcaceae cyanobacterium MO_234.B1]